MKLKMIVAEISKNWTMDRPDRPLPREALCGLFEQIIATNQTRGYSLHSFQISQVMTSPECLTETIIAVFSTNT